jgi:hypothetical protein
VNPVETNRAVEGLRELGCLKRPELARLWTQVFGSPPPQGSRSKLLCGALAWQHQIRDTNIDIDHLLRRLKRQAGKGAPTTVLASGTRLLREWQGVSHWVTVTDTGFEHNGIQHKSLSAIARKITGTAWSGPAFFGLKK